VSGLQQFATDDAQLKQRQQLATSLLSDDVAWTRLLSEVATVIPDDVWLTAFQGHKGAAAAATPSTAGTVGSVTFSAMGFDHTSAARWLLRMADAPSFTGVWLPSSTKSTGVGGASLDTFTSTADLTPAARSNRADTYRTGTS